jgi:uncharacterized protein
MADLNALRRRVNELGPVVVAFSGGADSALLAWVANDELGSEGSAAVTAVSPSLAPAALEDCRSLAQEWGLNYQEVETHEDQKPGYVANGADRCWHCKDELMRALVPIAASFGAAGGPSGAAGPSVGGGATVVLGVNVDDLGDYRPGQAAARDAGAAFPLAETGFRKSDVREISRSLGLRTWDKPAAACLASRLPYGTPVTLGALGRVARAEAALEALGFRSLRVRHYGDVARVELPVLELPRAVALREEVVRAVKAAGYRYVTLDLEGLRSGNLNDALKLAPAPVEVER